MTGSHDWADGASSLLALHPLGHSGAFFGQLDADWPAVNMVCPDLPGHGTRAAVLPKTFRDFVDVAADAMAALPTPIHVLGHSLGGAVAGELVATAPDRIATLTLVATPLRGMPVFHDRACACAKGGMDGVTEDTLARWFGHAPRPQAAMEALSAMSPGAFDAVWHAFAGFRGFEALPGPLPPTLVIGFTDDISTPPHVQDDIADALRATGTAVRRVDVAGAGHMGMMQQPDAVLRLLTDHMGTI